MACFDFQLFKKYLHLQMCLDESAQSIKFIILLMVICCQGNYVNPISLAQPQAHGAKPWSHKGPKDFLSLLGPSI